MKWLTEADIAAIVRERAESQPALRRVHVPACMFELESREDAQQLLAVLNRACRTWEPKEWPAWLAGWFERLERIA